MRPNGGWWPRHCGVSPGSQSCLQRTESAGQGGQTPQMWPGTHRCWAGWFTQSSGCTCVKNCFIPQQYYCNFKILDSGMSHPWKCSRLCWMIPWATWSRKWQPAHDRGAGTSWSLRSHIPTKFFFWDSVDSNCWRGFQRSHSLTRCSVCSEASEHLATVMWEFRT